MPPIYAMREEGHAMTQYLITFPSDAMNHIPDEEMPEVAGLRTRSVKSSSTPVSTS